MIRVNNDKRLLICYPLRLQRDDFEQLKKIAKRRDLTGAQLIRRAIRRELVLAEQSGKEGR